MGNSVSKSKAAFLLAMTIFGTIGIFRRYIEIPSGMLALFRGGIGTLFLVFFVMITKKKPSLRDIKKNLPILLISGALIGANWMLLFEAYRYTSVATATLCYYMAPVFTVLASPIFLKEKLTVKKGICTGIALIGMVLISGIFGAGAKEQQGIAGIFLGLGAAALYATIMILNKKLKSISAYDKTMVQLGSATLVLLPYVLFAEHSADIHFTPVMICMLFVVGILHTGVAYVLYFGAMKDLSAQTIALFCYLDPVLAILLSCFILHEKMGIVEIIGAVLILCGTLFNELRLHTPGEENNGTNE